MISGGNTRWELAQKCRVGWSTVYGEVPRKPGKKKSGANKRIREAKKKSFPRHFVSGVPRTENAHHTKEGAESKWDDDPE